MLLGKDKETHVTLTLTENNPCLRQGLPGIAQIWPLGGHIGSTLDLSNFSETGIYI